MKAMWAGYAKMVITPPMGVELCGYGYYLQRRATGVLDDLHVRCTALRTRTEKCLLLSADLIGLSESIAWQIRSAICERFGYGQSDILLVSTHTHTGPATNHLEGCGVEDPAYEATLPELFVKAAERAIQDEKCVTELLLTDEAIDPIGFNRTQRAGPCDDHVRGALIRRGANRPVALVSYGCHPVTLGRVSRISADYPGAVCKCFDERGMCAIFLNGLCGDIDPVSNLIAWGSGTKETLWEYAERIIDGFNKGLVSQQEIKLGTERFETAIPLEPIDEVQVHKIAAAGTQRQVAAAWEKKMQKCPPVDVEEPICVQTMRLNSLLFCAIPYEGYTTIGDIVRKALPDYNVAVLGCSDGVKGYLPTRDEWAKGSYAALDAALLYMRAPIRTGAAEMLGEEIGERLRRTLR